MSHATSPADTTITPTAITPTAIQDAVRLAGLDFTDAEATLALTRVRQQAAHYTALRSHALGNATLPAFRFEPRLPSWAPRPPLPSHPAATPPVTRPARLEELAFYPVWALAELVRTRQVTARELTDLFLTRLANLGPQLVCIVTLMAESARAQADQADAEIAAGHYRGPLHGIPYGAKDLLATRGVPTGWGAPPYRNQVFDFDATVVSRLADAGAILVAKLSMGSLAWGDVWYGGKTKTPWDLTQGSSGSSAGSGAATAAGLVPFAIGSETYGSIISPSTECGLTSLRPSFGRVSRAGAMTLAWTLDKLGPMCRAAVDCGLVMAAIHGPDGLDPTVIDLPFAPTSLPDLRGVRVGHFPALPAATPDIAALDAATHAVLSDLGATLVPLELPDYPAEAMQLLLWVEVAAAFDELTRSDQDDLLVRQGEDAWPNRLRAARLIPAVEYLQAQRLRQRLMHDLDRVMADVDATVTPSRSAHLWITNATGHPAITLPNGFRANGLPSTLTLTGHLYDEARLLAIAQCVQTATDFHQRIPPLFAP